MKSLIFVFFALVLVLSQAIPVYADRADKEDSGYAIEASQIEYENSPINKLGRGAINAATCWAEVPATSFRVSKQKDPVTGLTLGIAEGVFSAVLRGLIGVYDVATFIVPPYNKPLMKPEYALKSADEAMADYIE